MALICTSCGVEISFCSLRYLDNTSGIGSRGGGSKGRSQIISSVSASPPSEVRPPSSYATDHITTVRDNTRGGGSATRSIISDTCPQKFLRYITNEWLVPHAEVMATQYSMACMQLTQLYIRDELGTKNWLFSLLDFLWVSKTGAENLFRKRFAELELQNKSYAFNSFHLLHDREWWSNNLMMEL